MAVIYTLNGRISRTDGPRTKSRTYSNSASKTLSHMSETAKSMTCVDGRQSASVDSLGKRLLNAVVGIAQVLDHNISGKVGVIILDQCSVASTFPRC